MNYKLQKFKDITHQMEH